MGEPAIGSDSAVQEYILSQIIALQPRIARASTRMKHTGLQPRRLPS